MSLESEETYPVGLSSPSIRRMGDLRCYGLYATNKRIIFVRAPLGMQILFLSVLPLAIVILAWACALGLYSFFVWKVFFQTATLGLDFLGFAFLFGWLGLLWWKDTSRTQIRELEKRKVFEFTKQQVSKIEMKERTFLVSRAAIIPRTGQTQSILFSEKGVYRMARRLFQAFSPRVCIDV